MFEIIGLVGTLIIFFIFVNGILALFIRSLPSKVFDETRSVYQMMMWEKRFYQQMKITRWKNKLPQAGWMQGFSRRSLPKIIDVAYTQRFIWETCCAMLGHFVMAFAGLLLPFIILLPWVHNNKTLLACLWGLAIFHFFVHILYVMIQRYNLPRFVQLNKRLKLNHN